MTQEPSVGAEEGGGTAEKGGGTAAGQSMCFPSQAWELRSELAGQGDPVRLPGSAKTGNRALICGHGKLGTPLRNQAAPTAEESDFRPLPTGGGVGRGVHFYFHSCRNWRMGFTRDYSEAQRG